MLQKQWGIIPFVNAIRGYVLGLYKNHIEESRALEKRFHENIKGVRRNSSIRK